jgi:inosine-uridine nucleoside N-ribohydrolase
VTKSLLLLLPALLLAQPPEQIIFDTDSGFFGDDGAALVMLLQQPAKVKILGITVVAGNVRATQGAEYMFRTLTIMKRTEIPLYLGAQAPLVHTADMAAVAAARWGKQEFTGAFGETGPIKKLTPLTPRPQNAVDFIIQTVDRNPGQVTLFAIGPMTNIAMALRLRPDLARKVKRLVFMGGNVHVPGNITKAAEFNFWFDPEAAQVVLRSEIAGKTMFGLDICNHAQVRKQQFDEIVAVKNPITALYGEDLGNGYPGFFKNPAAVSYIWDALAAAFLVDPGFVQSSETASLDVDTAFSASYGAVKPLEKALAPHATPVQVMLNLDFNRVFVLYKKSLQLK